MPTLSMRGLNQRDVSSCTLHMVVHHLDGSFFSVPVDRTELAKLPGDSKVFTAIDSDPALSKFMDGHTPVEARIGLKVK